MSHQWSLALVSGLLALLAATGIGLQGALELPWWSVDGGGGTAAYGSTLALTGTAGQPDAGTLQGGPYRLYGGLWSPDVQPDIGFDLYLPTVLKR